VLARTHLVAGHRSSHDDLGSVVYGRPIAYRIPPSATSVPLDATAPGGEYLGIWTAFDLRLFAAADRFTAIFLRMRFDDPRVAALDLETRGERLGIGYEGAAVWPTTPLGQAAVAAVRDAPGWAQRLRYGGQISYSGIGECAFGWFFGGFEPGPALPLTYAVHAIIRAPRGLSELSGAVRADVSVTRGRYRSRLSHAVGDGAQDFALPLPEGRPSVFGPGADDTAERLVREAAAETVHSSSAVRLCLAADIERFSRFRNPEAVRAQQRFVDVLNTARRHAGLGEDHIELQEAGDGQLAILPPAIDESRVIPRLVDGIELALAETNRDLNEHARIRIRVALHRGHVVPGVNGWVGDSTIAVHRLLDSAPVRRALAEHPDADFALIVPDTLFQDIIVHRYGHLTPEAFEQVEAELPEKDFAERAWVYVPGPR
jgi:hypothetical protein